MRRIVFCCLILLLGTMAWGQVIRDGLLLKENGKKLSKEELMIQLSDINGLDMSGEWMEAERKITGYGAVWLVSKAAFAGSIITYLVVAEHPMHPWESDHDQKCFNACFWTAVGTGVLSNVLMRRCISPQFYKIHEILGAWEATHQSPQASLQIGALSDGTFGIALQF